MSEQAGSSTSTTKRARFSPESVDALLDSLNRLKINQPKAVSQTVHIYEPATATSTHGENDDSSDKRYITSWKMQEHLYRRKDCPFPTLARGLFTATEDLSLQQLQQRGASTSAEDKKKIRIVARGYDKFFNIGEVPWTEVGEDIPL
jgi:tRNA ligase